MHAAIRPYVTAGVALVGASVIAVAPVSPVAPSHIRGASPAVQLTAAPNPIVFYPQVAKDAVSNAGTLLQQYLTVPPALVEALVTQPIPTLVSTLRVFTNPGPYLFVPASLISPIVSGIGATVVAFADVITALVAGNATDFFNAVVDIPARIADGVLNGGYPTSGALPISFGGILTPHRLRPGVHRVSRPYRPSDIDRHVNPEWDPVLDPVSSCRRATHAGNGHIAGQQSRRSGTPRGRIPGSHPGDGRARYNKRGNH